MIIHMWSVRDSQLSFDCLRLARAASLFCSIICLILSSSLTVPCSCCRWLWDVSDLLTCWLVGRFSDFRWLYTAALEESVVGSAVLMFDFLLNLNVPPLLGGGGFLGGFTGEFFSRSSSRLSIDNLLLWLESWAADFTCEFWDRSFSMHKVPEGNTIKEHEWRLCQNTFCNNQQ